MNIFKKTVAAALAAITLSLAIAPTEAQAGRRFPGGGAGIAGAIFGGLILGAIAASAAHERRACGFVSPPVVDEDGVVVGYRRVRYCG